MVEIAKGKDKVPADAKAKSADQTTKSSATKNESKFEDGECSLGPRKKVSSQMLINKYKHQQEKDKWRQEREEGHARCEVERWCRDERECTTRDGADMMIIGNALSLCIAGMRGSYYHLSTTAKNVRGIGVNIVPQRRIVMMTTGIIRDRTDGRGGVLVHDLLECKMKVHDRLEELADMSQESERKCGEVSSMVSSWFDQISEEENSALALEGAG